MSAHNPPTQGEGLTSGDYEYEDGFQAGLETETSSELIERIAHSLSSPNTPRSWIYGLVQGWLSKEQNKSKEGD